MVKKEIFQPLTLAVPITTAADNSLEYFFIVFMPRHKKWRGIMLYPPNFRVSVRPSVRPSAVEHSCPVHNFDTVQDNFTKLGTNINHDQTTCRD